MINIQDKSKCCGCSACVQRCPKNCISLAEDSEGFLYPHVNEEICVDCGLCEKVCPVQNQAHPRQPLEVFAAKNPNEEIRMKSSSGGVFTLLAEKVIQECGVVFGAKFDENWEVVHGYTETVEGLEAFRGSKYVQSRIGESYIDAERFLKEGRKVLFSGTPCQIAGLRLYLRKEYQNLLLVDFVCHGVPSPMIWRDYLKETIRPLGVVGKNMVSSSSLKGMPVITGISFRDKRNGWKKFGFAVHSKSASKADQNLVSPSIDTDDDTIFYEPHRENLYMEGFLKNLYLRPSCYICPSKAGKSGSDYTLADLWGAKQVVSEWADDKGLSACLVFDDKLQIEAGQINLKEIALDDVLGQNPAYVRSSRLKGGRSKFFAKYVKRHRVSLIQKYSKYTMMENFRYSMIHVLCYLGIDRVIKEILKR